MKMLFLILVYFLPFYPSNNPNKEVFQKSEKKNSLDITILHMQTKINDQMVYGSWDMVLDNMNFFSFSAIFGPFPTLTNQTMKFFKKWKKQLEISSFLICRPNILIRWFTDPDIWCLTYGIAIFHFRLFFALLPI